jgi:hypothetical protein
VDRAVSIARERVVSRCLMELTTKHHSGRA